ncbi:RNA polymerase subunit sigma-24 [Pseudoxanthomonas kalamensis DSM 18571]|uniref:RNA polymerase sigma factor n=1 Tax=Pseudoxanthomonas kalamensis TaxID=289483 RepID=UPI001391A5C7|nr:RNA polymerase sigma factor [Pseudoxanthomonas kalamensis]KAF1712555.1 RNA polymerase subunit sigma-24 [Pseudoxanthomonas kalamensis DSM 18571]
MTGLHAKLDTLWRLESPRIVARLARMTGDVGAAEELSQDVLLAALERWPRDGVPDNPAAWLTTAARRRGIDHLRQRRLRADKHVLLASETEDDAMAWIDEDRLDEGIDDDLLRLVFVACHPVLPPDARVALTLRLLCGLGTDEIARAYLQSEATIAQRIVRAKRMLAQKRVPFEVPRKDELDERLDSVLEVVYLVFNEGYSASAGEDWMRPALCEEALRLGRVLCALMPRAAEVHGLLALMELQASRLRARSGRDGRPVLLQDQDRSRWDRLQIARGLATLQQALRLGGAQEPYTLQASIAACHATATRAERTDWARIAALYAQLAKAMPSPVVELNRAAAIGHAQGAQAALPLVDALVDEPLLRDYPQLPALRGDLLERLQRHAEARIEFERAAALTRNAGERMQMQARAHACRQRE